MESRQRCVPRLHGYRILPTARPFPNRRSPTTSGLFRRASLRTVQKAVKRFLSQTKILQRTTPESATQVVLDFWAAVAVVLREPWDNPRRHLINKGVGVYALMSIAADLYLETPGQVNRLSEFVMELDWTTDGPLNGFGGESGVQSALDVIRSTRTKHQLFLIFIDFKISLCYEIGAPPNKKHVIL